MPTELTDDEVFGAPASQTTAVAELSDADVFGDTPSPSDSSSAPVELSDADVFGDTPSRPAQALGKAGAPKQTLTERLFGAQEQSGMTMEIGDMGPVLLRTSPETQASATTPAFTIPKTELRQEDSTLRKAGGAAWNTVAGFVEGATSPEGLEGLLNPFVGGAQMAGMVPHLITSLREADQTPANSPERWQAAANVLGALTLPVAAHGAVKLAGRRPTLTERLFPEERPSDAPTPLTEKLFPEEARDPLAEAAAPPTTPEVAESAAEITRAAESSTKPPETTLESTQVSQDKTISGVDDISPVAAAVSPETAPPSVPSDLSVPSEQPRLRPGETQGDLLSTQTEDLTLIGEKGPDNAARQAETETAATRSEEARLKAEHEQGLLSEFQEQQARSGDELLDAIESGGGLPAKSSPRSEVLSGELKNIREEIVSETGKQKYGFDYNKVFKSDAPDLDTLTQHLRSKGFDVETPNDTLSLIQDRLRGGKPVHGNESRMTALEEASLGPGAASAKETLASYEQRRFGKRFQEDKAISPEIREQTGNQYYEPISNKVTVAEAEGIIEDYGTDTSVRMVRDESVPMQPRVRVTVGQALIKKLNQSHQEAVKAGDVPRAAEFLEQAVDTAEYLSEYGTTLGQGTQAFAIWSRLSPEGTLLAAKRMTKKAGIDLTPEQTQKIAGMTEEIQKTPEGFQRDEKTMNLMNFMSEIKGIKPGDVPTALWYSNILSGFSTQLVNTLDTGLNVFSESVATAASHPTAIPQLVSGLYQGMIKGGFEAANTLKTGKSITGDKILQQRVLERVKFGREGGVPISPDTVLGRFMKRAFESKAATPLNLWKYPLRMMVASDTVFFNSMKEARVRVMARALAKKEGLTGHALFQRVEESLNEGPGRYDAALAQAQQEGLTGLQQRRRVLEIIEQGRPEELVSAADEAAKIATYNHEPSGVLGLVAHNIANITEGFPPGKAIVPFTRIVANVANRGLEYTPWGYKRLFFGEWGGKKFATEPPVGEAYRTQLVKATLGSAAMTTVALLDANDTVQVTAKGPSDPEERKQLQNTGWKPYSVKVGNTFYSYQYTPFNLGFAMVGHYRDAVRYNKLSEKDASTRLAYGMLKASSTIFDMSFLSGVSDFIETVQGATSSTKGAGRLFSRTASSVVIPNLVKQTDKLFDPTVYQGDTIAQALIRETPVARGAMLKPMLNVLGEPIKPSQNRFFTFDTKDPVWKLIVEKQAWVPVPSKTTKIGNRPIKPDEYYTLIHESGPKIRSYITQNLNRFRGLPAEKVQDEIRDAAIRERDRVKRKFR